MKANELMQGDVVLYEYNGEKTHARVVEIYRSSALVENVSKKYVEIAEDKLFPIPLTPEILEKYGLIVKHPENAKRTYWKDCAGQIVGHKNRGLMYMEISGNPVKPGYFHPHFSGHIQFVHELQRALRLCRIEKEITF